MRTHLHSFLRLAGLGAAFVAAAAAAPPRPNILWISSEDHGLQMGCYGDTFATTPHIDAFAEKSLRYTHAWAAAPVCAPSRTTIISGLYGSSSGGDHMRSLVAYPAGKKMFPQLLREAGYYCTNNYKEDYNLAKSGVVWDNSSARAHWRNRAAGQAFFAVFNSGKSHEGQIVKRDATPVHDPAKVRVPVYHPDTPEVRRDWAFYYDSVTAADADAGALLAQLEADGLTDDTIVFYWADHGSGMPRSKRWPSDSGLHVPLLVHIPEKFQDLRPPEYRAGGTSDRLVGFVDFAPTLCSLAGIAPPAWMQGHAFLGRFFAPPQPYIYGFRGRMDERYDLVRSVTDGRYVYLRNYLPHLSQGQRVSTQFSTPTTALWRTMFDQGKLNPAQSIFWQTPKASEELYDLEHDRDEVNNLAESPAHREMLAQLRRAQQGLARRTRDLGFMPEGERFTRAPGMAPYDLGRDDAKYPFERIFAAAELASSRAPDAVPALRALFADPDSAVRYWAAMGLLMRGNRGVSAARDELKTALTDSSPYVRIAAAEALGQFGDPAELQPALSLLTGLADWSRHDNFVVLAALHALEALGPKAASAKKAILALPDTGKSPDARYASYVPRVLKHLRKEFDRPSKTTVAAEPKWISLFDGKTLRGWKPLDGRAKIEVRDGAIVGYVTPGVAQNSFLATEDDTFSDFIFEGKFRCDPGINSGVQFRSRPADENVKRVYGYQYEIDPTPRALTGGVQEEGGYGRRGPDNWLAPDKSSGAERAAWNERHGDQFEPAPAWNTMRIEARGKRIRTWLNGHLLADFQDDDAVAIPRGFFALQVHATKNESLFGKEIAFRNLRVQRFDASESRANDR